MAGGPRRRHPRRPHDPMSLRPVEDPDPEPDAPTRGGFLPPGRADAPPETRARPTAALSPVTDAVPRPARSSGGMIVAVVVATALLIGIAVPLFFYLPATTRRPAAPPGHSASHASAHFAGTRPASLARRTYSV